MFRWRTFWGVFWVCLFFRDVPMALADPTFGNIAWAVIDLPVAFFMLPKNLSAFRSE